MSALSPSTARLLDQIWDAVDRDDQAGAEKLCRKNPKAGLPTAPPQLQAVIALALAGSERTQDQEASYLKLKSLAVSAKDSIWPDGLLLAKTVEKTALRLSDRDGFRESVQALANLRGTVASFWRGIARDGKAASDIVRQWILFHVGQKNWKDAKQATMGLRRSDPSNRDYLFWAILFSHLLSTSKSCNDVERGLFGTLAYRMITKALADTLSNTTSDGRPAGSITTAGELLLLLQIYEGQHRYQEALTVLEGPVLSSEHPVIKQRWQFVLLQLKYLQEAGQWQKLLDLSSQLITDASTANSTGANADRVPGHGIFGDDMQVWRCLILASRKLNHASSSSRMALEVNPKDRNARIAELQLLALKAAENDPDGEGWRNRLKDACLEYLLIFRNKACAFDDMRPFMDSMDYLSLDELIPKFRIETGLDDLSSNVDVQSAALSAQLCHLRDHAVRDGTDESPRAGSNQSFHIISQQLNHARRETVGPGRESGAIDQLVLILAVEMMESMEKHNLPSTNLQPSRILRQLRAAAILQYTLEQSPLSHDVRLPIVLLYRNLGAVSLQLSAFSQLSVKHVQWDTIGHLAFERISTIHPWPLSPSTRGKMEPDQYDPIRIVETVQDFYRMTQEKLPSKYKTAIEEGSYDQVVGFQEFEHRVESSLCRLSSHHEELAVSRIRKEVPASGGAINASSADDNDEGTMSPITRHGDICDNRDDSVYPIWSQHGTHNLGSMWRPRAGNGESVPMIDASFVRVFYEIQAILSTMESATGNSGPQQKFSGFAKEIIGCTMRLKRLLLGADAVVDVQLSLSINLSDDIPEEIRATVLTNQEERFVWLVMKSVGFLNADLSEQASIGAIQEADSFIEDLGAGVSRRSEHRASNSASTQLPSEIVGLVLDPTDNLRNGKEDEGDLKPTEAREAGLQVPDWSTLHSWYTTLQCAQYLVVLAQTLQTMGKGSSPYARHIKSVATKDRMRSIRSCATSLHVETLDSARKMKDQLEASGVVTRIVDDIFSTNETGLNGTAGGEGGRPKPLHGDSELDGKIGEAVRLALGGGQKAADWAEEWATNVRDSWVESIEGVLKVKL